MSNKNNNYESNKRKRRGKSVLRALGIILASALMSCAFIAGFSFAKENVFEKDRNPDNLLTTNAYYENLLDESSEGLKMNWKDDGSVVLSAKHSDDDLINSELYSYEFASLTLDAGDYTLTTGNDDADSDEFGIKVAYGGTVYYVGDDDQVIHLDESATVTFSVFVKNNRHMFFEKLLPTLVEGVKPGEFYK